MSETTFCVVCGGSIEIPSARHRSDTWSHSSPEKCVGVLRSQRETLQGEVSAWEERAAQAESALSDFHDAVRASLADAESVIPELPCRCRNAPGDPWAFRCSRCKALDSVRRALDMCPTCGGTLWWMGGSNPDGLKRCVTCQPMEKTP